MLIMIHLQDVTSKFSKLKLQAKAKMAKEAKEAKGGKSGVTKKDSKAVPEEKEKVRAICKENTR